MMRLSSIVAVTVIAIPLLGSACAPAFAEGPRVHENFSNKKPGKFRGAGNRFCQKKGWGKANSEEAAKAQPEKKAFAKAGMSKN